MTEQGYVYYRRGVTTDERDKFLNQQDLFFSAIIQYDRNKIQFKSWPTATLAMHGQAFGEQGEVRWWPDAAQGWHMLFASEKSFVGLRDQNWQETEMVVEAEIPIYLWGDHWHSLEGATPTLPDGWVQAQIEADLHYPVSGSANKPAVRVTTKTYYADGLARLTRFVRVTAVAVKEQ